MQIRRVTIPNPKLKLLNQVSEVMRFKHYALRTETTYRGWIRRYILFHDKRHPREMGPAEVSRFLSDLAVRSRVAASLTRSLPAFEGHKPAAPLELKVVLSMTLCWDSSR